MTRSLTWAECQPLFVTDGSLRDLHVLGTSIADWERFFAHVRTTYPCAYAYDGEPQPVPPSAAAAFARRGPSQMLDIQVGRVTLCCHFFTEDEIELDLLPNEVTCDADFEHVLSFMQGVGMAVRRNVRLTPENSRDERLLEFDVSSGGFVLHATSPIP